MLFSQNKLILGHVIGIKHTDSLMFQIILKTFTYIDRYATNKVTLWCSDWALLIKILFIFQNVRYDWSRLQQILLCGLVWINTLLCCSLNVRKLLSEDNVVVVDWQFRSLLFESSCIFNCFAAYICSIKGPMCEMLSLIPRSSNTDPTKTN